MTGVMGVENKDITYMGYCEDVVHKIKEKHNQSRENVKKNQIELIEEKNPKGSNLTESYDEIMSATSSTFCYYSFP